jgi:flagellar protein FlbD
VITLTRISGNAFVLNCDLIERIDSTPDTVVSLVDGKKYVVLESPATITASIRQHRSEIIALSHYLAAEELTVPPPRSSTPMPLANVASINRES